MKADVDVDVDAHELLRILSASFILHPFPNSLVFFQNHAPFPLDFS